MTLPTQSSAATRVLWVGRAERAEIAELASAGVDLERALSLPRALALIAAGASEYVAYVDAEEFAGRDSECFVALRDAGAAVVVGVYPPALAWRAARATFCGADHGVALPAWPGELLAAMKRNTPARAVVERGAHPTPQPTAQPVAQPGAQPLEQPPTQPPAPLVGPSNLVLPPRATALPPSVPQDTSAVASLLGDVAVFSRSIDDVERMLDQALSAFARRSNAERCSILLFDRLRTSLALVRSTTITKVSDIPTIPAGAQLVGKCAREGEALRIDDVAASPLARSLQIDAAPRGYRTNACLLIPLRGTEQVVGVACFTDRRVSEVFTDSDVATLAFLADRAGQAIENGQRFRQLQELAAVDELTGLANRRQFQVALEREVQRARRYDRPLSLAILDLDHFKEFNDRCGHQAGDYALAKVGEILRTTLRDADVVARYGGEEFAVILPETNAGASGGASTPFPFLERLRRRIEETKFPGAERLEGGKLTVSGGVASFPDDALTVEDLIREADRALYVSKSRGRNSITYRERTLAAGVDTTSGPERT